MKEILLLKCGELVLKGLNRNVFEQKLITNLRRRLKGAGEFRVYSLQSTIYVEPVEQDTIDRAFDIASRVFGIASIARAAICEKDLDDIYRTAADYLSDTLLGAKTFKVECKRSDKRFALKSPELAREVGGVLLARYPHLTVDVHNPDVTVMVEIRDLNAFIHAGKVQGPGGMPVGSNGRAALLLSGGIDSPVAGHMIAKRGVELTCIHFFSYPYTSEQAKEKVVELAHILARWAGRMTLKVVPFTKIQEAIRDQCPEDMFTLVMRRFMMRIAQRLAQEEHLGAIVTGESLGQVASQTMEAMLCTGSVCSLPVFRPLIGMDKEEIVVRSRAIGAFETSILPYEDCCTVFTPRHPLTKPRLSQVEEGERGMDVDALVEEACALVENILID